MIHLREHGFCRYCKINNLEDVFRRGPLFFLSIFTAADAAFFEKERAAEVGNATVNRGLAVLSNLLRFALMIGTMTAASLVKSLRPEKERIECLDH
jgi:hypothetical protein